jgi:hypothetical protein
MHSHDPIATARNLSPFDFWVFFTPGATAESTADDPRLCPSTPANA